MVAPLGGPGAMRVLLRPPHPWGEQECAGFLNGLGYAPRLNGKWRRGLEIGQSYRNKYLVLEPQGVEREARGSSSPCTG